MVKRIPPKNLENPVGVTQKIRILGDWQTIVEMYLLKKNQPRSGERMVTNTSPKNPQNPVGLPAGRGRGDTKNLNLG